MNYIYKCGYLLRWLRLSANTKLVIVTLIKGRKKQKNILKASAWIVHFYKATVHLAPTA